MKKKASGFKRTAAWLIVFGYSLILPHAIIILKYLERNYSVNLTGRIPVVLILLIGTIYILKYYKRNRAVTLRVLTASFLIIVPFILLEPNPNKHIHIPEYIVMSGLIFHALSLDYQGKGIYLLTLVSAGLLGVIDEIQQGILTHRYYGFSDMLMNASSGLVGDLLIIGIKGGAEGDWLWVDYLKKRYLALATVGIGLISMGWTCFLLFGVSKTTLKLLKNRRPVNFSDLFPAAAYQWNLFAMITLAVVLLAYVSLYRKMGNRKERIPEQIRRPAVVTSYLWIFVLLSILLFAHVLFFVIPYINPHFM